MTTFVILIEDLLEVLYSYFVGDDDYYGNPLYNIIHFHYTNGYIEASWQTSYLALTKEKIDCFPMIDIDDGTLLGYFEGDESILDRIEDSGYPRTGMMMLKFHNKRGYLIPSRLQSTTLDVPYIAL